MNSINEMPCDDNIVHKTMGHCSDGCQWIRCYFWKCIPSEEMIIVRNKKTQELEETRNTDLDLHVCTLFGGARKHKDKALVVCNKVYGTDYKGQP